MPLIPWRPFLEPFEDFDAFWGDADRGGEKTHYLAVDIYEKGDNVIVEAPLAGIKPENVDISVENNVLTIKGKIDKKSEVEDKNYYRREVRTGSFYRCIPLSISVIGDKASAVFENGVLKISVPKAVQKKTKKIDIQVKEK